MESPSPSTSSSSKGKPLGKRLMGLNIFDDEDMLDEMMLGFDYWMVAADLHGGVAVDMGGGGGDLGGGGSRYRWWWRRSGSGFFRE
ncbi:hypothetical protein Tco_1144775 [Tanacetum coccineum]